ncbi:MAG: DUF655 domain-containing protein [Candidatus Micrarchaeia archaeon]
MTIMEDYGIVVDFLPYGKATDTKREPVAQVVGESFFTLLEVIPKAGVSLQVGERVYIGKGEREKIDHIKTRISYNELTSAAKSELRGVLLGIVRRREADYTNFFNKCGPVTIRLHQLELLPGVGKKHMHDIISEREKRPFANFADISARVPFLPDPAMLIVQRIEEELRGDSKYYILTRPPQRRE